MPRTKIVVKAAFAGLVAVLSVPAAAQYGGGSQQPPPEMPPPRGNDRSAPAAPAEAAAAGEVLRAAACAIGRSANIGTALLATVPRSTEERTQAVALLRTAQRCLRLREQIATSALAARGAVAEALYETQFAAPPAARTPPLGAAPLPRPAASGEEIVALLAPMYALVDCATPRQPDLVRALLATEPRTPEESTALTALNPAFIACVPAGSQLSIDPRIMRSFFAEALYRWSVVQRDGPTASWAAPAAAPAGTQ